METISQAKQTELLFKRAQRVANQDIHDSYITVEYAMARVKALDKALKSAETNYNLQLQDYKLNLVNNLDVLAAIQSLEDSRRNYMRSSYEAKRYYHQLLVAAGRIKGN